MGILQSFQKDPPKILYHYTTAKGLIGILTSKSIWATHVNYLNDKQEFVYLLSILQKVMEEKSEPGLIMFSEMISSIHKSLIKANFTVTSFSESPDLLSQWRAYSSGCLGYCIGFDTDQFVKKRLLYQCVYDVNQQMKIVTQQMDNLADNLKQFPPKERGVHFHKILPKFLVDFVILALFLKNPAFQEEKEISKDSS